MLLSTSNLIPGFLESAIRIWATDTANCRLSGNRDSIYIPIRARRPVGGRANDKGRYEAMIRKLESGQFRLYSRKKDPKTGRRRNLGTFSTRKAAEAHERAVQYFKRH
jgi:hypothetical protein